VKQTARAVLQRRSDWLIPAALIALSLLPLLGGITRMLDLASGDPTPKSLRFFESPTPIVLHVLSSIVYSILGALQFSASLRQRRPQWHRMAGRILIPCGAMCALTGIWMAIFYPPTVANGTAAAVIRVIVGVAILVLIGQGFIAIRERNFAAHRASMIRAYALAIAAGSQPLTLAPVVIFPALYNELGVTLGLAAGWMLNIIVGEWVIRRKRA